MIAIGITRRTLFRDNNINRIKAKIIRGLFEIATIATDEAWLSWIVIEQAILDIRVSRPPDSRVWPNIPPAEAWFRSDDHSAWAVQAGLDPDGVNRLLSAGGLI